VEPGECAALQASMRLFTDALARHVLEYFDAHLVGLTATPSKQTFGFFNQNLVMEYGHYRRARP
jgi:type I site-specific restriction endonuclease